MIVYMYMHNKVFSFYFCNKIKRNKMLFFTSRNVHLCEHDDDNMVYIKRNLTVSM